MRKATHADARTAQSGSAIVKRWDGSSRLAAEWDQIRKDPELWSDHGNCLIHLAAPGQSRRGPAFLVPTTILAGSVLATQISEFDLAVRQTWDPEGSFTRKQKRLDSSSRVKFELFLPPPSNCPRESIFDWHVTTRNYVAFCLGVSIVGQSLGQALIALHERLEIWRPSSRKNTVDLVEYADRIGYLSFAHCPDYALAALSFAEKYRVDDLWIDAFAHCVGMYDMLSISGENEGISFSTKSIIKKYAISMDGRLKGASISLSRFLEEDLPPEIFGVNEAARIHLNVFREFLSHFYSQKLGGWPPRSVFSKSIFRSMSSDFHHLHDYLVDLDSSPSSSEQGLTSSSVSVLRAVQAFDKQYNYNALPYPLCRLPQTGSHPSLSSRQISSVITFGSDEDIDIESNIFTSAANTTNYRTLAAPIVKAFQSFESSENQAGLSVVDARKTRWILVYSILQILRSVTTAPPAVRDIDTPTYMLCCETQGLPPWNIAKASTSSQAPLSINALMQGTALSRAESAKSPPLSPRSSTSPDFQADEYIRQVEIAIPSWRDVFSMRDPSTVAFKNLQKQMDTSKTGKSKSKQSVPKGGFSSKANTSRYSLNLLGGKKNNVKERERDKERAKIPALAGSSMARKESSSTGRSSQSNKSSSIPGRVDSMRSADRSASALSRATSKMTLSEAAGKDGLQNHNGSTETRKREKHAAEPRSPDKGDVAPWEAMEPTMSGAAAAADFANANTAAGAMRSIHANTSRLTVASHLSGANKTKEVHARAKSIPLVPSG